MMPHSSQTVANSFLLSELLADLLPPEIEWGDAEKLTATRLTVAGLSLDSRQLVKGDLFFALAGEKIDGRQFITAAIEKGAVAILVEADKKWKNISWINQTPVIAIEKLAQRISEIAGRFYQHPSRRCRLVGITGTNGKTTCALLIAQLTAFLQKRAGLVGTLGFGVLDSTLTVPFAQQITAVQSTGLTTPDPIRLQKILAHLVDQKTETVALEVSSHSLVLGRVAALEFDTAIFTNLTQDHLDFHGDLNRYAKAKELLLHAPKLRNAIINIDDKWAKSLLQKIPAGVKVIRFSVRDASADIYLSHINLTATGAQAKIHSPWGEADFVTPFIGNFNLSNLVAVIAGVCTGGFTLDDVVALIPRLLAAPGRMESVTLDASNQDITVIVDYAHTPDALENSLKAIREHTAATVWTLFGCGGDRDKTKRPLMGRIAELNSDYLIVTNDNPRTEEPAAIATDIIRGLHNPNGCLVIADRAKAIDFAVQEAKAGDVILIAGKGHEDYQIFAEQTLSFSDTRQARIALQRRLVKRDLEPPSSTLSAGQLR
jgi:UDP-N-acetylmuramoyl-L-alanyl-D-glutamate--2,6-diaminopimelate ligase